MSSNNPSTNTPVPYNLPPFNISLRSNSLACIEGVIQALITLYHYAQDSNTDNIIGDALLDITPIIISLINSEKFTPHNHEVYKELLNNILPSDIQYICDDENEFKKFTEILKKYGIEKDEDEELW